MRINILGWYNRGNCGDEAFKLAFKKIFPTEELNFQTPDGPILPADKYILGGGDVINPYYIDWINEYMIQHPGVMKEFYVVGAGLGYQSELSLLHKLRPKKVWFRNLEDVYYAESQGFSADWTPDLVFNLQPEDLEPYVTTDYRTSEKKKLMGVFLTDHVNQSYGRGDKTKESHYAEYLKWELAESLDYLAEWYKILFIPLSHGTYAWDTRMNMEVLARMKYASKQILIQEDINPADMIGLVSKLDMVVSMKFHGIVFPMLTKTPFVNIGLSRKTQLLSRSEVSITPYSFTKKLFLDAVNNAEVIKQQEHKNPGSGGEFLQVAARDAAKKIRESMGL
jgi:polysaccharide pyruvyl transferase WcaK-like protein